MAKFEIGERVQLNTDIYDWDGDNVPAGTLGTVTSWCVHSVPSMYEVDFGKAGRHALHDFQFRKADPPATRAMAELKEKGVTLTEIIFALSFVYPDEWHKWSERNAREVIELFEEGMEQK